MMRDVRPIDANALYDQMTKGTKKYLVVEPGTKRIIEYGYHADDVLASIDQAPTLDYAPVGRGQWEDGAFENSKRCTKCGRYSSKIFTYRENVFDYLFCPYCGKKCGEAQGDAI